jgi:hypothetical protein
MLGNIARKLRIFGYNTEYFLSDPDNYILKRAIFENRIILTRDKGLHYRLVKKNLPGVLISSDNERDNLVTILRKCGIDYVDLVPNPNTRCTKCNGDLISADKSLEIREMPEKVYSNIQLIYKCNTCSKIYWNGTHMDSINLLITEINKRLQKKVETT